jgi:DNA-binding MarR family transcriptional regulator
MSETIKKLEQYQPATPTNWREKAEFRRANKSWLRYSQHVAMMMLDKMEAIGLTQRGLAERMGCSQQYVSKILKGQENLSIVDVNRRFESGDIIWVVGEQESLDALLSLNK